MLPLQEAILNIRYDAPPEVWQKVAMLRRASANG